MPFWLKNDDVKLVLFIYFVFIKARTIRNRITSVFDGIKIHLKTCITNMLNNYCITEVWEDSKRVLRKSQIRTLPYFKYKTSNPLFITTGPGCMIWQQEQLSL